MPLAGAWSIRHDLAPLLDIASWGGALGVVGLAFLLGLALLPRLRGWRFAERALLRLLAGLLLAPLLVLGLGQIPGALAACPWAWLALAGWAVFGINCGLTKARSAERGARRDSSQIEKLSPQSEATGKRAALLSIVAIAGWVAVAFSLLLRLFPAFCPPLGYDTLEYHMGIIPHVFEAGRYTPIPHIFYSAQPQATEALYTLAALFEKTPWGFAPGALHWLLIVLGVIPIARILALLALPAAWIPWSLLLFLEHPLIMRLQMERMTDWFGVLTLAGGLWVYLRQMRNAECGMRNEEKFNSAFRIPHFFSAAALLGLFAGGGVEAKWTHSGTVAAPLLILALGLGAFALPQAPLARRLRGALATGALAAAVAFLVWLPWGCWLWAMRRNPFAPFLAGLFPSPEWPAARLNFLLQVHGPLSPLHADYWQNLVFRLAVQFPGLKLIVLALAAALFLLLERVRAHARNRNRNAIPSAVTLDSDESSSITSTSTNEAALATFALLLTGGMIVSLLLWGNLAQAADRFLAPTCLASLAILAVAARRLCLDLPRRLPAPLRAACAALPPLALIPYVLWNGTLREGAYNSPDVLHNMALHACGRIDRYDYLRTFYEEEVRVIRAANALPAGSRILVLNDARRYLYTGAVETATVFDESPVRPYVAGAGDGETIRRRLRAAGYTHVVYHGFEQVRLLRMQTPPRLAGDPAFNAVLRLPDRAEANTRLARDYWGIVEFAVDPPAPAERTAYGQFLTLMQRRATVLVPQGDPEALPAFWLAPL